MASPEHESAKRLSILIPISVLLALQTVLTAVVNAFAPGVHGWLLGAIHLTVTLVVLLVWLAVLSRHGNRRASRATFSGSEPELRALLEHATDVIALVSPDGRMRFASPAIERVLGYPASQLVDRDVFELVWPDDVEEARQLLTRCLARPDETVHWNLRLRHADGTPRWLDGTSRNRADDPALKGVVVAASDVTARRREDDRRRTMSRAIEQSPTSIIITDTKGTIEYVNPKFCVMTGYSAEEAIGRTPRILKSGKNSEETYRQMWETILSGHEWRGELTNRKKNGDLYREFASISPVVDERGRLTHFVADQQDITEWKRAESALRDSEELFQQVFTNAPVGIAVANTDGRWIKVNPALCQMVGYSPEELIGMSFHDITYPADLDSSVVRARALLTGAIVPYALEKRYIHKDGRILWVQVHIAMVRDASHTPLYYTAMVLDITARKEGQEALDHWARELSESNRVLKEERAARERVEMELHMAQKLEAIGQLAAGIAHEINTPMQYVGDSGRFLVGAIPPLLEALDRYGRLARAVGELPAHREEVDSIAGAMEEADVAFIREEIPQALDRIVTGVQRVSTIVKAMKEFAHPGVRERMPADINHMIENTLVIARNEYKHVANVVTDLAPLPPVSCNVGELNQVFLNILVNAAHAIAEKTGGDGEPGTITIRTRPDGDAVIVEIQDTGCGIPEAIRTKVFDPFFTTKPPGRGTGQGLGIARTIVVTRHGGKLTFTSEPGRGTCFTIRLPIATPAAELLEAA